MRSLAIFVGLLAGLTLSTTIGAPSAEAKGIRQLQYTVKEGDTIYDLARRFGCAEQDLARANQLGEVLPIGKKLRIPDCRKQTAAKAPAKLAPKPAGKLAARPNASAPASKGADADQRTLSADAEARDERRTERRNERLDVRSARQGAAPRDERTAPRDERTALGNAQRNGARGDRLAERATASRTVEIPQRAHGKVAGRPRLPAARAKAHTREAHGLDRREGREAAEATSLATFEATGHQDLAQRDDAAADALAAAVAEPSAAASTDPVTGSIAEGAGLPRASGVAAPVTGSIAAPAAALTGAALTGAITRPSELERARAAKEVGREVVGRELVGRDLGRELDRERSGDPSDDLGELGLGAELSAGLHEDEPELPADHKLVLDGRAPRRGALLDPAGTPTAAPPIAGQSIGLPWRGRLQSAARLGYGEGYVLRRPHRTYGTRTTVAHVESALAELRHKFPRLHTLAVGDLSAANGGRISEHRSHQSGRDIDLGLCFHERPRGYPEHFVVATEKTLNAAATWALISALADTSELDGGLSMIFLDFNVQGMIYRWALAEGIDQERLDRIFQYPHGRGSGLGVVRHAPNHADHLHARFRCASDETGCRQ